MNPEYSIIQSSAMTHPYKRATVDVLSKKIYIFRTMDPSYNEL